MKAKSNFVYSSLRFVLIDLVGDLLYWPLWWYSRGLKKVAFFCLNEISGWEEILGLHIWLKNIFTPMFGQYDLEGRLISFFVRLIQIIVRFFLLLFWTAVLLILLVAWIILPVYIFYQAIDNFSRLVNLTIF